ncbi:MAG: arsenate reductase (glutaredoxin), partial [Alphaproteobacteria bacterium]|nr:arsenate reductase (glutaredoxin) [Alphaproteobacteria bacterium]
MTTSVKIYHNPKCSKSRSALELIQQKQLTVEIIEYLKFPPHSKELADIIKKL